MNFILGNVYSSCGGNINDSIQQIRYPYDGYYNNFEDCIWNINRSVPIHIQFIRFYIEKSIFCFYDWLQIKDNTRPSRRYCGYTLPTSRSLSGKVKLVFHSDSNRQGLGFIFDIGRK